MGIGHKSLFWIRIQTTPSKTARNVEFHLSCQFNFNAINAERSYSSFHADGEHVCILAYSYFLFSSHLVCFCVGALSRKLTINRGYCELCKTIVWLNNSRCPNIPGGMISEIHDIEAVTSFQVYFVLYLAILYYRSFFYFGRCKHLEWGECSIMSRRGVESLALSSLVNL